MKAFAYIDTPPVTVKILADEIYNYLQNYTSLIQDDKRGWQFIDTNDLLKKCVNLSKFFQIKKLFVRNSAVTISYDDTDLPLHIDEGPVIAKINIPVRNTNGWVNVWYDISQDEIDQCQRLINQFGKEVPDLSRIKNPKVLTTMNNFTGPVIFNSLIPHAVIKLNESALPRIVASFTFFNEPIKWLE